MSESTVAAPLQQFNARLSPDTIATINALAVALGCSQAAVIHQAVRLLAKREGVEVPAAPKRKR
jgi:hypothetical protein